MAEFPLLAVQATEGLNLLQSIVLAMIQGITEFLPISSSAHLILPSQLLGWPDQGLAFDVAVHFGSLMAVGVYFRRDLLQLSLAWVRSLCRLEHDRTQAALAWWVALATVPAGLAGLLWANWIELHLRSTWVIAWATIGFGLLLWVADRYAVARKGMEQIKGYHALIIGLLQVLALIPGTSRSGITMTAGLLLGLSKQASARFSFLLSIPLILAATVLKTNDLLHSDAVPWGLLLLASLTSALTAYLCIALFLRWIERMGFMPFVLYRLALGGLLLALVW